MNSWGLEYNVTKPTELNVKVQLSHRQPVAIMTLAFQHVVLLVKSLDTPGLCERFCMFFSSDHSQFILFLLSCTSPKPLI